MFTIFILKGFLIHRAKICRDSSLNILYMLCRSLVIDRLFLNHIKITIMTTNATVIFEEYKTLIIYVSWTAFYLRSQKSPHNYTG